jgi:Nif-specific regulatory protein
LLLAEHFLQYFCRDIGRKTPQLTAAARKRLYNHTWPGNVRELRNLMERVAYLSKDNKVDVEDLFFTATAAKGDSHDVAAGLDLNTATHEFQRGYIHRTVERARGNISEAAKQLGVHRSNLYRKMRQLDMTTDEEREAGDEE